MSEGKHCLQDDDCDKDAYCYKSGFCAKCTDCSPYNRQPSYKPCPRNPEDCGPCISGYEAEELVNKEVHNYCNKKENGMNNNIIIAIVIISVILLVGFIFMIFTIKGKKIVKKIVFRTKGKQKESHFENQAANLQEIGDIPLLNKKNGALSSGMEIPTLNHDNTTLMSEPEESESLSPLDDTTSSSQAHLDSARDPNNLYQDISKKKMLLQVLAPSPRQDQFCMMASLFRPPDENNIYERADPRPYHPVHHQMHTAERHIPGYGIPDADLHQQAYLQDLRNEEHIPEFNTSDTHLQCYNSLQEPSVEEETERQTRLTSNIPERLEEQENVGNNTTSDTDRAEDSSLSSSVNGSKRSSTHSNTINVNNSIHIDCKPVNIVSISLRQ